MMPVQSSNPEPQSIQEELERILRSSLFGRTGRGASILRRIVDLALAGRSDEISEKTLAADLSGHPETFTAVETSQIRTAVLRLRHRLDDYYSSEGRDNKVRIAIPKGSYAPVFVSWEQSKESGPVSVPFLPRLSANLDARRLYLEARLYLQRQAGAKIWLALDYLRRALQLDPSSASTLAAMADCYFLLATMSMIRGQDALQEAAPLLDLAVQLDPACGDAWASIGAVQGALGWRWAEAERFFRRAMHLSLGVAGVLLKYSSFHLLIHRRFDEAQRLMRQALELQPNAPRVSLHYVIAAFCRGDIEEARTHCLKTLEIAPRSEPLHMWLGRICCAAEAYEEALVHFRAASKSEYTRHLQGYAGYCYARLGRTREARRVLDKLSAWSAPEIVPDYIFATIHLGLGDMEKCLDNLEASVESRCPWAPLLLTVDPLFKAVRRQPRAIALVKRMNLAPTG